MSEESSSSDPKKTTPKKWDSPKDARQSAKAGKYPNYYSHKTRSGHTIMMDDSNGAENITIQHRAGSMIQFMPDGCVQLICDNGQYNITFGESRIFVSGAQDIVVQGDASLSVDGNYKVKVKGNAELVVEGDYNITAKNLNQTILGNIDTMAKNKTDKIEGSVVSQSTGATSITSDAGMMLSSGDSLGVVGQNQVALASNGGELMMKSGGKMSLLGRSVVAIDGTQVKINEGASDDLMSKFVQKPAPVAV